MTSAPRATPTTTDDEDAAAVLVVLAALATAARAAPTSDAPQLVWGLQHRRATGPDAWWASGLPR